MKAKAALPILACMGIVMLLIGFAGSSFSTGAEGAAGTVGTTASSETKNIEQIVFPQDKVFDVNITIDPDDFQSMLDNASAEEMKTASVEYNGVRFDNIGIRTKGNLSLRSVVNSDSDRYSFKLSFDEYLPNQTFYGISKINLNNNYSDSTYMREFLTYELAREMGLPTPEFSYVNVYVNGELWGFYLAVEQVGDSYLQRNFGNSYGALYKAEMNGNGGDLLWRDDQIDSYPALTQKSKSSNGDFLLDLLDELNNGSDYESVLDVEEALKYIALNVLTVNTDSYLGQNKQNYYLYEDDGIFSVLPWDYNMAFGGLGGSQLLIDEPTQGAVAERPLVAKLLQVDEYKAMYHQMLREAVEGYLSPDTFAARVQQVAALIAPYAKQDPRPFYTYEQFESGVTQLVSSNSAAVQHYAGQLDGTIASSGDGSGSGGGMGMGGGGRGPFGQGVNGDGVNGQPEGGAGAAGVQTTALPAGAAARTPVAAVAEEAAQQGRNVQQTPDAQQGQTAQQAPNAQQGQAEQQAPNTPQGQAEQQAPNAQQGQMGQGGRGQFGQGGMGGGPGGMGMGGGGIPGMPGTGNQTNAVNRAAASKEAYMTAAFLVLLLLACWFVSRYKRKRL